MSKSPDFVKLDQALKEKKGAIRFVVIKKEGEEASGTSQGGASWRRQRWLIEDDTSQAVLVTWNDDIEKTKPGYKYELVSPQYNSYNGKLEINPSKYGGYHMIGSTQAAEPTPPATGEPTPKTKEPEGLDPGTTKRIKEESILLYKIRKVVHETIADFESDPHGGMIGQFTELIYKKYFSQRDVDDPAKE